MRRTSSDEADVESSNVRARVAVQAGLARKVSVSLPEDLTAAVRAKVGPGGFSRYVTEAVRRQFELDQLAELVDDWVEENGPIPERHLAEASAAWPDES